MDPQTLAPFPSQPCAKLVEVLFNNVYIASTRSARIVWELPNRPPVYYLPQSSFSDTAVERTRLRSDEVGHSSIWKLSTSAAARDGAGGKETEYSLVEDERAGLLRGFVRLVRTEMDAWFEDGALTLNPPKSPHRRIDIGIRAFPAAGGISVAVRGVEVARAGDAVVLYETGLPVRYYLPATAITRWDLVRESATQTACPYKGEARYFSVEVGEKQFRDVIWYYLYPIAESGPIAGRLAFDPAVEGVEVLVEGVRVEK